MKIADVRESKGVSQIELASRAGMSAGYLSQLESGKRRLDTTTQQKFAKALSVDPNELVDFSDTSEEDAKRLKDAFERAEPVEKALFLALVGYIEGKSAS